MVSLVDIGPATGTVPIRGSELVVHGMTASNIVLLFNEFPELRRLVTGKADKDVMSSLFDQFAYLTANITAACVGAKKEDANYEETVQGAARLTLGEQWLIIEKTMEVTFPQTVKNFIDSLFALVGNPDGASGWAQATTLPVPSSNASKPDEPKPTVGTAPLDSSAPGPS